MRSHGRKRGSAGFTLLEALIAIVILALSLSALLQLYSTGLRGIATIDDNLRARLLAQSVMAEVSYDRGLRPGRLQGRSRPVRMDPLDHALRGRPSRHPGSRARGPSINWC